MHGRVRLLEGDFVLFECHNHITSVMVDLLSSILNLGGLPQGFSACLCVGEFSGTVPSDLSTSVSVARADDVAPMPPAVLVPQAFNSGEYAVATATVTALGSTLTLTAVITPELSLTADTVALLDGNAIYDPLGWYQTNAVGYNRGNSVTLSAGVTYTMEYEWVVG